MKYVLRPYQLDCLNATKRDYEAGIRRILCVLATGSGKSFIIANIAKHLGITKKILLLAHKDYLLVQLENEMRRVMPDKCIEIEQGNKKTSMFADVIIASVPTLGRTNGIRRIEKYNPNDFGLLVVDEAQHGIIKNSTYYSILEYFGVTKETKNPKILLYGTTATSKRLDGVGLEEIYDTISYNIGIKKLVFSTPPYLAEPKSFRVLTDTNLDGIDVSNGDFIQSQLEKTINTEGRNNIICNAIEKYAKDKQTVIFCAGVGQAEDLNDLFNSKGMKSAIVTGKIVGEERVDIIEKFKSKEINLLLNFAIFLEGFDVPGIECICIARCTKSEALFQQMIGRGLRLSENKNSCLVLDIVDSTLKHKLITTPSLFGLPSKFDANGGSVLKLAEEYNSLIEEAGVTVPEFETIEQLKLYLKEVDLMAETNIPDEVKNSSEFAWYRLSENKYGINLADKQTITIEQDILGNYNIKLTWKENFFKFSRHLGQIKEAFEKALDYADTWIRTNREDALGLILGKAKWRNDSITDGQKKLVIKLLAKANKNIYGGNMDVDKLTKGQASVLIGKLLHKG